MNDPTSQGHRPDVLVIDDPDQPTPEPSAVRRFARALFTTVGALFADPEIEVRTPDRGEVPTLALEPGDLVVSEPGEAWTPAGEAEARAELEQFVAVLKERRGFLRYLEAQRDKDPHLRIASPVGAYRGGRLQPTSPSGRELRRRKARAARVQTRRNPTASELKI